ncbi:hypothetical protein VMUT_1300 [Vulcanisaeta moutnovskia 768-28]|uniref:Uncharacterized protein n=1 Tax=Vulcanisaeta moutnovskia (strain 768-28) TaxID=985053 RepID=F0QYS2_VULM7|nr:hypothetical protein [Vulcanisaeta moutnovskia]ADY01505.1 hypothetical protein VMUT_1300 [Vulcanisaeta moutnovskia 768-28]
MKNTYIAYLPWYVKLEDGTRYKIPLSLIMRGLRSNIFIIKIPSYEIRRAVMGLIEKGFKPTLLAVDKGESYSLSMRAYGPWELHTRIFNDGTIETEVEINRDYLQHLVGPRFNVVYETYESLRNYVSERKICIRPFGMCIGDVIENIGIELRAPKALIPWKPIAIITASLALAPILNNLSKAYNAFV